MIRASMTSVLAAFLLAVPCAAQEWADKMVTARSYDFGNIARGAKAEFAFEVTNLYLEDVHIASVRASCGCTTPRIEKDSFKTYEKVAVTAHINSDRFVGNQGSTITVTIDKPPYAQVQLHVKVHIFSDVLLEPSGVVLGGIAGGNSAERTIRLRYTGHGDWQVTEVRSGNPHLTDKVTEIERHDGQIAYDLKVVLAKDAPVGYLSEYVWLITNGPRAQHIPVPVEAQVQADISVSPASLFLGVVQPGQSVTKQIVVRGQKPFRIASISTDCQCLQATSPKDQGAKALYLVPITFTAREKLNEKRCIGCEMCVNVCPHAVFQMEARKPRIVNHDDCMEYGARARNCPTMAISVHAGIGYVTAIIKGAVRGAEPACECAGKPSGNTTES